MNTSALTATERAREPGLIYRMVAPSRPDTPRTAREWVALVLRGAGCDLLVERARLCTSEVVTNAYQHTVTPRISVELALGAGRVTVFVRDRGSGPEDLPPHGAPGGGLLDTHGRGLALVGAYADDWAMVAEGGSKAVWFSLVRGADRRGEV
ncbi:ATP-binding protein [Streptomyces sp. NPDC051567]|uniref:ATP-binding protein n=1 Tax=Streptomyces sp. NPDC051567 TaxID=3365660 RepID=UPI0037A64C36